LPYPSASNSAKTVGAVSVILVIVDQHEILLGHSYLGLVWYILRNTSFNGLNELVCRQMLISVDI